ncbi:MAG: tyrosine-type recombinase/integrase [Eubacteriales bacterium]|nr:tyrosine-type recombinase/integrase [Eubacteriales bacterium]
MLQFDYDIEDFMSYCQSQNLRPKTMHSYEQAIRLFQQYVFNFHNIDAAEKIQDCHIKEYIKYLQERGKYVVVTNEQSKSINFPQNRKDLNKPVSETTINNYLRNMKVFFNYMYSNHNIRINPFQRIKRKLNNDHKPVDFIQDDDFKKLIKSFDMGQFHEYRDSTVIQLLIDTGMRIGECLLIKTEDIDVTRRSIYLQSENTKARKSRMVFYCAEMGKILKQWLQFKDRYRDSDYLFCTNQGKPLTVGNFETNFKGYTNRVRIKNGHPHMLRNNFARRFLLNGGDIYTLSRILGHSSVVVTEKAYLDLDDEDLRINYAPYSPLTKIMMK